MHRVKQLFALYVAVVWVLFASPAETAERKALVIGNNNYVNVPALRNARSDAEAIARSLRELGFKVDLHTNLEQRQMLGAVRSFIGRLNGGDAFTR